MRDGRDVDELQVTDGLHPFYLASRPGYLYVEGPDRESCREFAREMRADGVGMAVVLLTPPEIRVFFDLDLCELYRSEGVEPLHYPVEDSLIPEDLGSFHRLILTVERHLATASVLAHCNAGLGRTGLLAAGLLVHGGSSAAAAISCVRRVRRGALENRIQEGFISEYQRAVSMQTPRNG